MYLTKVVAEDDLEVGEVGGLGKLLQEHWDCWNRTTSWPYI
jgi:hypothetical protein